MLCVLAHKEIQIEFLFRMREKKMHKAGAFNVCFHTFKTHTAQWSCDVELNSKF